MTPPMSDTAEKVVAELVDLSRLVQRSIPCMNAEGRAYKVVLSASHIAAVESAAALIESQRATIERVERERDEADRRAGAAERDNAHRREADVKRQDWLDERKRALGYETGISFDRVWDDTLAKANRAEAAEARVTALEAVLQKFLDFADAEYVPNTLFVRARQALSPSTEVKNDEAQ